MNQNISRRLEQWLADQNQDTAESVLRTLHRKLCERTRYCFNTEKRVEEKIKKWLTDEEQADDLEDFFITEESLFKNRQILAVTKHRVILFEYNLAGTLTDKSDKIWRQLVSVHLQERISTSSMELCFFEFHESIFYPNPNQFSEKPKMKYWRLDELNKKKAHKFYTFIKNKEITIKEERRKEHLENKIVGGPKMPPAGGGK